MRPALLPAADLHRHREAFLKLVARARLAPPTQRADLLHDAMLIAVLHRELTGVPLLPGIAEHLHTESEDISLRA